MCLLFILPIAGLTCLLAVVAKAYDETISLRSERKHFERELNIFDDAQLEQRQFLNPNRVTKRPTKRPTKRTPTKNPTRPKKPTTALVPVTNVEIELPARPFRLRLYWNDSYRWQNLSSDPMFCMGEILPRLMLNFTDIFFNLA